jgi:hypothetical protein
MFVIRLKNGDLEPYFNHLRSRTCWAPDITPINVGKFSHFNGILIVEVKDAGGLRGPVNTTLETK